MSSEASISRTTRGEGLLVVDSVDQAIETAGGLLLDEVAPEIDDLAADSAARAGQLFAHDQRDAHPPAARRRGSVMSAKLAAVRSGPRA
jgi:hypothetical protein